MQDDGVVKWIVDKLEESWYAGVPVTINSGQEPAMMKLKQAVAVRRKAETPLIESPVRESQAKGRIERTIRKWQAQLRTMRHHLESRLGAKIDNNSALVEWMIVWLADILSKYTSHENGRTFYEMATQHVVKHKVVGFAEKVHFQFQIQREKRNACKKRRVASAGSWAS